MEEFEYTGRDMVYRLNRKSNIIELYLDDMMEWTIKLISLGVSNECKTRHNIALSYDYNSQTRSYQTRVMIARLLPRYNECIKPDLRVSMNDKIKIELIDEGGPLGEVNILAKCFMPDGCDITKSSPFNMIQDILKKREEEEKLKKAPKSNKGADKKEAKGKGKKKGKKDVDEGNFDEEVGKMKKQKSRLEKNGALIEESLTLEDFLKNTEGINKLEGELMYRDHSLGTGAGLKMGQRARLKCTGRLANGHFFQRARRGESFDIRVGNGEFVSGLEKGIIGMKVGGTRTVVIPPELGYGAKGTSGIPGGSTLIFEVRLIAIDAPLAPMAIQKKKEKK